MLEMVEDFYFVSISRRQKEIQMFLSGSKTVINKEFEKNSLNKFTKEVVKDEWDRI